MAAMECDSSPSGSQAGLKAVFLQERSLLLRLLTARLGTADDAEDALQDIWVKLDTHNVPEPVAQPTAYLCRMASNLAADRRLATARSGARDTAWQDAQPTADEQPDAERALLGRERLRQIEAEVATMPERMRVALRLYRIEDQPQKEIAERLGMTVSGVEKLLRRAVRQICASRTDEPVDEDTNPKMSGPKNSGANESREAETAKPHRLEDEGNRHER
jgi:RNA polymerase sigma-70 factor (ECF subfamily)